jgi:hypothetical protein
MSRYLIPEDNIEALRIKLSAVQRKCEKYECSFVFEEIGEVYREHDGQTYRFIEVEAEGTAKINGWKFLAKIEHTDEGNVVTAMREDLLKEFHTLPPNCDHCRSKRSRSTTYIVENKEGERKQVGKSCLKAFTGGFSAATAAYFYEWLGELKRSGSLQQGAKGGYIQTSQILPYIYETIRIFGFRKSEMGPDSSWQQAFAFWRADNDPDFPAMERTTARKQMEAIEFAPESHEAQAHTAKALEWLKSCGENSEFIMNLKTVCANEFTKDRHLGFMAALFPSYTRAMEKKIEQGQMAKSAHVGTVGERIKDMPVTGFSQITAWDTEWGCTFLYRFLDAAGNIFTWKSSVCVGDTSEISKVTGTVKAHSKRDGICQTELTRCKTA